MSKLLVIDDDVDLLEMTVRRLKRRGFDVVSASTLTEARTNLLAIGADCIGVVCDLFLCGENGVDFYEELKEKNTGLKFILATGDDSGDDRIEKYKTDKDFTCLQKPFELNLLIEILEKKPDASIEV